MMQALSIACATRRRWRRLRWVGQEKRPSRRWGSPTRLQASCRTATGSLVRRSSAWLLEWTAASAEGIKRPVAAAVADLPSIGPRETPPLTAVGFRTFLILVLWWHSFHGQ